jgi:NADPH:quinone reductase-like Zn-dependent oxidoreductase
MDHEADHIVVTDEDLVARVREITRDVGARVVFDPVGGPSFIPLTDSMARGGILLEYGGLSTEPTPFPLFHSTGQELDLEGLSKWRDHERRHCPKVHCQRARFGATEARHRTHVPS